VGGRDSLRAEGGAIKAGKKKKEKKMPARQVTVHREIEKSQ
jgi:hypothetical protein